MSYLPTGTSRAQKAAPPSLAWHGVRFTQLHLHARLVLPANGDVERAKRLLEKAEKACLVTNSLALAPTLTAEVTAR